MEKFRYYHSKPLNDSLEDHYTPVQIFSGITFYHQSNHGREFSLARSPQQLQDYIYQFHPNDRSFHEIFVSDKPQKPRFDLDIEVSKGATEEQSDRLFQQVISGIILATQELLNAGIVPAEDLMVFQSHQLNQKWSYHIIITRFACWRHYDAKKFFDYTRKHVDSELRIYMDDVTKGYQSLRMMDCVKFQTNRLKQHLTQFQFNNQTIKSNHQFADSLVSYTAGLPIVRLCQDYLDQVEIQWSVSDETVDAALRAMCHCAGVYLNHPRFPYQFEAKKGNLILLRRVMESRCPICLRMHEHENPYLLLDDQTVRFYCRRSEQCHFITDTLSEYLLKPNLARDPPESIKISSFMPELPDLRLPKESLNDLLELKEPNFDGLLEDVEFQDRIVSRMLSSESSV